MSTSYASARAHPMRLAALALLALLVAVTALVVSRGDTHATPASNFMEGGSIGGDRDVRAQTGTPGLDWANTGSGSANTCPSPPAGFTVVNLPGTEGLFNCGMADGNTTTPLAPIPTSNAAVGSSDIAAVAFAVDPLGTDVGNCSPGAGGSTVPPCNGAGPPAQQTCAKGDPTVYTGAGGEKNGDPLSGKGVETFALSTVPGKDEITNVYAIDRKPSAGNTDPNEVFFGAERVINNGESHIDFEFLQSAVTLVVSAPCSSSNEGQFQGHRAQGDFVGSIEYTKGGSLGGFELNQWHCLADTSSSDAGGWVSSTTQAAQGTVCDPNVVSTAHYQLIACTALPGAAPCPTKASPIVPPPGVQADAVNAVTNDAAPNGPGQIPCGGWVCRDGATGAPISTIDTNELMEGSVNLAAINFTGCISTFIPHTRTSQSFTSTLKDFALIPFNTCRPSTTLSLSTSPGIFGSTDQVLVHKGDSVTFNFTETNDSVFGTPPLANPSVTMGISGTGAPSACTPTFASGDSNGNSTFDIGESWVSSCSVTFNTAGSFTITGVGHGTFNGSDVTYCTDTNNPPTNTLCDQDERAQTKVNVIAPATTLTKSASPTTGNSPVSVTYSYSESNGSTGGNGTSDLAISGVSISDDTCSPVTVTGGDTDGNSLLDAGETWTFTCGPKSLTATTTNTATATGTDALGFTVTFCGAGDTTIGNGTVCSPGERSSATVTVRNPGMSVAKSAAPVATVTYTYAESNTGDVILTNPSVSDDKCTPVVQDTHLVAGVQRNTGDTNNDGAFDPGETWNFKCSTTNTLLSGAGTISVQNTATALATDTFGNVITKTDSVTVGATITVTKP
jgi:hypothetical protein